MLWTWSARITAIQAATRANPTIMAQSAPAAFIRLLNTPRKKTTKIGGEYVSFPHVEDEVLAHCEIDDCCVAAVKVPDAKELELAVLVRTREPAAFAEISKKLERVKQARSIRYIVSAEQPFTYTESFRIVRTLPNPMSPQELTRCGTVYDRKNA